MMKSIKRMKRIAKGFIGDSDETEWKKSEIKYGIRDCMDNPVE
jgi:hypothetical protein